MAEEDPVPSVGSQVARYSFIREIARGPLGPLYECRKDGGDGTDELLARVVALPVGLPAVDEKQIEDAAWDSAATAHELTVRVADVVFGKGWFTLVHDSTDGILLSLLEDKATAFHLTFPPDVAVRIVLDVLEGLELSKEQCDAAQLSWRTGSVSPHSLTLCRDGRTRALDGQVTATALRFLTSNQEGSSGISVPPEVLADPSGVNERVDVFMVGSLLWGLLTGRKLDLERDFQDGFADIGRAVPEQINLAKGLIQAIGRALKAVPEQRQGSLRELTVALVMGTEKVATYPEVLDFVDALLLLDSSREVAEASSEVPSPPSSEPAKARLSMISWADDDGTLVDARVRTEASSEVPAEASTSVADAPEATNTVAEVSSPVSTIKGTSTPLVTRAALTSNRPPKTPPPSDAVKEVLQALEKKASSKAPPAETSDGRAPTVSKERKFQLSMSTLVLGFSTTVLAVIVFMLLVMRSQSTSVSESKRVPEKSVAPSEVRGSVGDAKPSREDRLESTPQVATQTPSSGAKATAKPRATKSNTSSNNKATPSGNEETFGERPSGRKHLKNYVPNDL